jgi:hypothetical protein
LAPVANQNNNKSANTPVLGSFLFTQEYFLCSVTTIAGLDTHLGLNKKLTLKILTSKIRHENDDIFKNALSKKGLE